MEGERERERERDYTRPEKIDRWGEPHTNKLYDAFLSHVFTKEATFCVYCVENPTLACRGAKAHTLNVLHNC